MQSSGAGEKSNYLSAYSLGGEEGCGERRGRNEKEKEGKEIGHIKEVYLPAIYSVKSWPHSSHCCCFCQSVNTPRNPFSLSEG